MQLLVINYITTSFLIQIMETPLLKHDYFVVYDLITPAILGLDFYGNTDWYWISPVRS